MKTGLDVFKMILLGANRVGFATMAMLALGCTVCRKCNQGTCHKGITTQHTSLEEAQQLGLKAFTPLNENDAVHRLSIISAIGEELRQLAAGMGSAGCKLVG
jgi:glutamate synthase (NADPH/NADH) large chain